MSWERYEGETVTGNVRVLRGEVDRDLLAYLPPSHGLPGRRFPVVYMNDGQNLFDEATSPAGEWRVDETMEALAGERAERRARDARRLPPGLDGERVLHQRPSRQALYVRPDVFGFAGLLSPAFWWNGDERWYELVEREPRPDARVYMDMGDDEGEGDERLRRAYVEGYERMAALLRAKGYGDDELRTVFEPGGVHLESAWGRRLPDAFRFLLPRPH